MVEKLKSISKRTNWSLLLKAVLFAAAWWVLPFWLFLLVALYLYFIPVAGSANVALPFLVLLLIAFPESPNLLFAIILAIIFYYIVLIRDLLIIDRRSAYEILVLALSYLLLRSFFMREGDNFGGPALFYAIFVAWALAAMVQSFIKNFSSASVAVSVGDGVMTEPDADASVAEARSFRRALGLVSFMLFWQLLIVGLFLPLNFVFQSAIVFMVAAIFIDLIAQYAFGELSRTKVLAASTVIFCLLVIVLASAHWMP
jgi:hypothetical protein